MSDIDYICSDCGGFDFLYARPRWCPYCAVRVDAPIADSTSSARGVKRKRNVIDNGKENKRYIEFNENKRILDKKINIGGDGLSLHSRTSSSVWGSEGVYPSLDEYDALIKSWVNIQ